MTESTYALIHDVVRAINIESDGEAATWLKENMPSLDDLPAFVNPKDLNMEFFYLAGFDIELPKVLVQCAIAPLSHELADIDNIVYISGYAKPPKLKTLRTLCCLLNVDSIELDLFPIISKQNSRELIGFLKKYYIEDLTENATLTYHHALQSESYDTIHGLRDANIFIEGEKPPQTFFEAMDYIQDSQIRTWGMNQILDRPLNRIVEDIKTKKDVERLVNLRDVSPLTLLETTNNDTIKSIILSTFSEGISS